MIVRPESSGELLTVFRSKEQTYSFDFPYQCGTNCDLPYDAVDNTHSVSHNDIVIVGSDGLFDNLFDDEIKSCVKLQIKNGASLS